MKNVVDEVRYSKSAQKFIKTRDAKEKKRIKDIIETNLKHLPATGDIKPLEGVSDSRKRLRIGSIRIIFRYDEDNHLLILSILDIGNRGDIYKQGGFSYVENNNFTNGRAFGYSPRRRYFNSKCPNQKTCYCVGSRLYKSNPKRKRIT